MITHHSSLEVFEEQIAFAINQYTPHNLKANQFSSVLIGGLGGSGIGGKLAKNYLFNQFPMPIDLVSDYHLPAYVNKNTLLILGSYSGNTEETLMLFHEAIQIGCTIVVVSAGGELTKLANEKEFKVYKIESGFQPRMALGYSLSYLLLILGELMGTDLKPELQECITGLKENKEVLKDAAQAMLRTMGNNAGRRYVIIADAAFEGIAWRFAQQLNENSKVEAFVSLLPESNHNVIESYYGQLPTNFVVLNSNTEERVSARFDFVISLLERENNLVWPMETNGVTLKTLFEVNYILDWYTILITEPLQVDPMKIENIMSLKDFLTEI